MLSWSSLRCRILPLVVLYLLKSCFSREFVARSFSHPKVYRCGDTGQDLVVNFVNKNYPDDDTGGNECKFRMVITNPSVCQVRVDFVDTELMKPIRGDCLSQQFEVEGDVWPTGLPPLCGRLDDQHFYLHLEHWTSNATVVDFKVTTVVSSEKYRFGVWLTQIDCSMSNVLKAPEGCTQYYLGEKGTLKSFNFDGQRYLNGANYQICIRPRKNVCGIRYSTNPGEFALKKSVKASKEVIQRSGTGAAICGMDYLLIPNGQEVPLAGSRREARMFFRRPAPTPAPPQPAAATSPAPTPVMKVVKLIQTFDRYCGGKLSPRTGESISQPIYAPIRSNLITLFVRTSGLVEAQHLRQQLFGKVMNTTLGFRISYQQLKICHDCETDLAARPILKAVPHHTYHLHPSQHDQPIPLLFREQLHEDETERVKNIVVAPDANLTLLQNLRNKTLDISDDDKMWEYLDPDNNSQDEYDDLYDF